MANYNEKEGVWRTVGGRRIFIPDGEDLSTAMKNSGKFGSKKKVELSSADHEIIDDYIKDAMHEAKDFTEMDKAKEKVLARMKKDGYLGENAEAVAERIDEVIDKHYGDEMRKRHNTTMKSRGIADGYKRGDLSEGERKVVDMVIDSYVKVYGQKKWDSLSASEQHTAIMTLVKDMLNRLG